MLTAARVLAALFGFATIMSGIGKLRQSPQIVAGIHGRLGVPLKYFPLLGGLLIAGGVGLLAGFVFPPFALAAAIGLVLYFLGAIVTHLRAGDTKGLPGPVVMLAIASATLATHILAY